MNKQELLERLFAVETALCEARTEMENIASDCWSIGESPEGEEFWDDCENAIQERADAIAEIEDWLFQIKEGNTTIEEAVRE